MPSRTSSGAIRHSAAGGTACHDCWCNGSANWRRSNTAPGFWNRGCEFPDEFRAALWWLACQCGYVYADERVFAADGGSGCWDIHAHYNFSEATGLFDWYHAIESAL